MKNISPPETSAHTPAKAWLRALELTAPIAKNPLRTFPVVLEELAETHGEAPALLSDRACLTYRALSEQSNRYARWALDQNLAEGEVVCLLMPNRPEYLAIWLGITRVGGVVSLLNTNLIGPSLAHCMKIASPRYIIVAAELVDALRNALVGSALAERIWVHGGEHHPFPRIDHDVAQRAGERLSATERRPPTVDDRALYIYTSGTTGLPKAANISHFRLMQWTHWFAGLLGTGPSDRIYNCLPMYHSVGGVLATGAVLVGGGSVVIRENFTARQFWSDISRWECTLFQYIGELCRYLLRTERLPNETSHRLRACCGNGLRADIWQAFKTRFQIPRVLEFYASTEGNVSLFNVESKPGAVGRVPPFLAHRFQAELVRLDAENKEPVRDEQGFCVRCARTETGEAIGKIPTTRSHTGTRFDGYTSEEASEAKILRNVFKTGDAWFRTGDLLHRDDQGYFYFMDRIGDTFRWKGENVSTTEVSEAICAFPGIKEATVYGVEIPGTDGRAGMAALVADGELDLTAFQTHLAARLPAYAQPLFLRLRPQLDVTATFKHAKRDLERAGYDPASTTDAIYFNDAEHNAFVRLDTVLYDRIQAGQCRL